MNDYKLLPDDPKLTAYALGELDPAEHAAVEVALRDDPVARAAVEEIRALGAQLEGALAAEPLPAVKAQAGPARAKAAIIPGDDYSKLDGGPLVNGRASPLAKVVKFPQFYYVAACAAAACFAVMVALRTPKPEAAPQKVYTEIDLASLPPPAAPVAAELPVATTDAEKSSAADSAAPAAVTLNLAPATPATQTVSTSPSQPPGAGASLLEQAKAKNAERNNLASLTFNSTVGDAAKKDSLLDLAARNEPVVITSGARPTPPVREVRRLVADAELRSKAEARVQQVSTPPPPNSATGEVVTLSAFNVAAPAAWGGTKLAYGADKTGAASTSRDGMIVNEVRGRLGYVTTNLDSVAPAGGPVRAASADRYADVRDNEFLGAAQNPLSTFAIDVDTASYANVRRFLRGHQRPPRDAVRIEELVNYFPYRYTPPTGAVPFAASLEVAEAPWAPTHRLVRIGLKGREVSAANRPAANLVFLLDVSGSMSAPNRLPLVKESMRLLVGKLRPDDRVAIVTYAGQSGLALASTPVSHATEILDALDVLGAGGSTNGAMGIQLAYDVAKANFTAGGINRVILCTDGDFNVGVTGEGELTRLIEEKAKTGVALTALGFGMGNFKDATLEKLADHGNGNYGYIDTRREAEKMLVEQVNGTLMTIAKDVKIQVDFNPARVASYRLLGYENRLLKKEDFNNDAVDAGEIGAGHTVTALYEIVPTGVDDKAAAPTPVDESKYQRPTPASLARAAGEASQELLTVKLRYKEPAGETSQRVDFPLTDGGKKFADASADFKFAAAVAGFGMIMRESPHKGTATMADVVTWAESGNTDDAGGYRAEFVELAREAEKLTR